MRKSPNIRRSRRVIPALSILSFLVLFLAACGGGGSPAGNAGSATSANLTWWGWTPSVQVAQQYIKAFNKKYPDIHITYKMLTIAGYNAAIRPALASSVGPDIFDVAPGGANGSVETYAPDAIDLSPAVSKALGSGWQSKLSPIGVSSLTIGKKLAAVSVGAVYSGTVWINQNLFDQYHLTPPTTMAQWVSDCATFKAHNIGCFVQGVGQTAFNEDTLQAISDNVQPGVWAKAIDGQVPWTDPTIVKALTIWKSMFSNGIMEKGALGVQQYPDANNDFLAGKYAMVMMGTWYMQNTTTAGMSAGISGAGISSPKNFTAIPILFPDVAGTGTTGALYGDSDYGIAVNAKSKNQAAATKFAVWLGTSAQGQSEVANALDDIAALKGVQPDWSQISLVNSGSQQAALSKLITSAVASSEPRLATVSPNLQTAIGNASTTVASGSATPAKAAATLQAAAAALPNHGAIEPTPAG
jgi:ABC-type glycerol-3-phosphate transport system substrate-binding protein